MKAVGKRVVITHQPPLGSAAQHEWRGLPPRIRCYRNCPECCCDLGREREKYLETDKILPQHVLNKRDENDLEI